MTNRRLLLLGKSLFSLSFLFIFTGLFLYFDEKGSFYDPIKDTVLVAGDSEVIISTTDDVVNDNSDDNDNNIPPVSEVIPPVNDDVVPPIVEEENDEVVPDDNVNSNTQVPNEVIPPVVEEILPEPSVDSNSQSKEEIIEQEEENIKSYNNNLRKTIEETYSIIVKYGSETDGYKAGDMSVVSISDVNIMKRSLEQLNECLSLYPKNFFKEFGDEDLKLKVYLIQRYSTENVTGITELYANNVTISIAMDYSFAESFHHEVYHYIEHYIERMNGEFGIWNTYNPNGFIYGESPNSKWSFNQTLQPDAFFVNNYAQSDADEDRASTFEYMTANTKALCYDSVNYPIWKKSSYIALMIDTYFDTVDSKVIDYWERFIY